MHRDGGHARLIVRFVFAILCILVHDTWSQQQKQCSNSTTDNDFKQIIGRVRVVYRISAIPNTWSCLSLLIAHDDRKGGVVYTYKEGPTEFEKRASLLRNQQGKILLTMDGQDMPVKVASTPEGVIIIHVCSKPGPAGNEEILIGYLEGSGKWREADEEAKKYAQYPNQYRVQHQGCKPPPPPPPTTPTPPTTKRPTTPTPKPTTKPTKYPNPNEPWPGKWPPAFPPTWPPNPPPWKPKCPTCPPTPRPTPTTSTTSGPTTTKRKTQKWSFAPLRSGVVPPTPPSE